MRPSGKNANAQLILPGEKKIILKVLLNFILNYHQKTQRFQSVKQSNFCQYRACNETDVGKSKIENVENGKKKNCSKIRTQHQKFIWSPLKS